jgi:predicted nucleotidyltransferase
MRQPARPSSVLHHPLDQILGSPVLVRVLRVIAGHGGQMSAGIVAHRAEVTRTSARNALYSLVRAGVVESAGSGGSVLYRLRGAHPLAPVIGALFSAEADRASRILESVRAAAEQLQPPPRAVWLFGSVARRQDHLGSDLDLAVVGTGDDVEAQAEQLREALDEIGREHHLRPSVITITLEEARRMADEGAAFWKNIERDAIALMGQAPRSVLRG